MVASTRVVELPGAPGTACEVTLWDNGQPLSEAELAEPIGGELLRRLGATVALRSGPAAGAAGYETVLSLTLPVAP